MRKIRLIVLEQVSKIEWSQYIFDTPPFSGGPRLVVENDTLTVKRFDVH